MYIQKRECKFSLVFFVLVFAIFYRHVVAIKTYTYNAVSVLSQT